MKLIPWLVALYNRRWQKKLNAMIVQLDKEDSRGKLIIKYEPVVDRSMPTKEEVMEAINSQPTHLSNKFQPRRRKNRKYKPRPLIRESILDRIIDEEFKQLSKGGDR